MLKNDLRAAAAGEKPLFSYSPLLQSKVSHLDDKFLLKPATLKPNRSDVVQMFLHHILLHAAHSFMRFFFFFKCIYRHEIQAKTVMLH